MTRGTTDHAIGLALLGVLGLGVAVLRVVPDLEAAREFDALREETAGLEAQLGTFGDHLRKQTAATAEIQSALAAPGNSAAAGQGLNLRLAALNDYAQTHRVSVNSVRTGAESTAGPLRRRSIDATYTSSAGALLEFLTAIRNDFPDFAVEGISIQRSGEIQQAADAADPEASESIQAVRFDLRLVWTSAQDG